MGKRRMHEIGKRLVHHIQMGIVAHTNQCQLAGWGEGMLMVDGQGIGPQLWDSTAVAPCQATLRSSAIL